MSSSLKIVITLTLHAPFLVSKSKSNQGRQERLLHSIASMVLSVALESVCSIEYHIGRWKIEVHVYFYKN